MRTSATAAPAESAAPAPVDAPAAAAASPKEPKVAANGAEPKDGAKAAANAAGKKEKKQKKEKKKKEKKAGGEERPLKMEPPAAFLADRNKIFDELWAIQEAELAAKIPEPIKITLPDGNVVEGQSWRTTPYEVANGISSGLANTTVVAKVNGEQWDLDRPFEESASLELLKFGHDEGKYVFWHSSAHVLGQAMEQRWGCSLCYGPPIADGFYYDGYMGDETVSPEAFKPIDTLCKQIVKEKQVFQRLTVTKEDLLRMFAYNKFKCRIINERVDTPTTTVYRCGDLIDLCRGPHVRNTGKIKAISAVKTSSTYWEGNAEAETLQRIYGISFPDTKALKEWKHLQEEAAKRDHRKIGKDQELFFFHELSPGCCFFYPRGAYIYNTLIEFQREQYLIRGFSEVVTPNMYNSKLWETSGHWQHYSEDMFSFDVEEDTWALKPMNCPGHCVMFGSRSRSYKELPLRFADFGVLHRNEASGSLTGLTRVRRFQQDDAHIFCMPDQIESEMAAALDFVRYTYSKLGFKFEFNLSTRPKKFLGDIAVWDFAEAALKRSLDAFGAPWEINPEDGAFYGPKIDITIEDALKRKFQCATIQLDFQLPIRFNLEYVPSEKSDTPSRPVIIHRAILGSVERCIAILCEHYGGKWPFWLNPRQAQVVPVVPLYNDYACEVRNTLKKAGFMVDADINDSDTLNKKVRTAQMSQYNFIFVVGEAEQKNRSVTVRDQAGKQHGERTLDETLSHFRYLKQEKPEDPAFPAATPKVKAAGGDEGADAPTPSAAPAAENAPKLTDDERAAFEAEIARLTAKIKSMEMLQNISSGETADPASK